MSDGKLRLVPGVVKPVRTEKPIYLRIVPPIALVVALCGLLWFLLKDAHIEKSAMGSLADAATLETLQNTCDSVKIRLTREYLSTVILRDALKQLDECSAKVEEKRRAKVLASSPSN